MRQPCVDTEKYKPELDATGVRKRFALENQIVIGFIGTFGKWHGAENLAMAFCELGERNPELRGRARLLMIGDRPGKNVCEEIIRTAGCERRRFFADSCRRKMARNILPPATFLFPRMCPTQMALLSSAPLQSCLAQLDTVLEDEETALKIPPGDVPALAEALEKLCLDSSLRRYLGRNARLKAESCHSWNDHARRIMDKIWHVT